MRSAAAVILVLAVASARADDTPAPSPAPGADSIAAAKKDFAAIRSTAISPDTNLSLPTLDMKDVGPSPGAPAPIAPAPLASDKDATLDPTKKTTATGNWLVDAMDKDKNPGRAQPSRPGDDRLKADTDPDADPDKTDSAGSRDAAETREATAQKEPGDRTYNPLDSFMASWISARDHDLLVPASKGDGSASAEGAPKAEAPAGPDPMPSGSLVDMLLPAPDAASWSDSKPDANPFIAPPDSDAAPAVRFFTGADSAGVAPFGLTDSVSGPSASGVQPSDSSRTFIPDFAQPSDDDKYFKQMKRF
jgi:hypothetical protein